jgi:hypothetical protein
VNKPVVIFHGNCQAQALGICLAALPGVTGKYDVLRFSHMPSAAQPALIVPSREQLENCEFFFLQTTLRRPEPDYMEEFVARGGRVIRFPAAHCPPLWPQECQDKRNQPEPGYPRGRFPFGDRVLLDLMAEGHDESEIVERYVTKDFACAFRLDRLMQIWQRTMQELDTRSDVKIGSFILHNLSSRRLFHAVRHPGTEIITQLLAGLVQVAWGGGVPYAHMEFAVANAVALDDIVVPVHPSIANALQLRWYGENDQLYEFRGHCCLPFREYVRRYVRYEA